MKRLMEALSRKPFAIVGHRGAAGLAPENTLAALEAAIRAGADVAEFDVQSTADGVLVASHDPVLTLEGGVRIDIRSSRYEDIKDVRVCGERIPRIEEIVEAARGRIALFLEVKVPGDTAPLVELLRGLDAVDYVAVISFEEEAVRTVKRLEPRLAAGIIYFRPPGKIIECKKTLRCEIVLPRYPLATEKAVALAHRLGLKVVAWTVDDTEWALRLARRGVDAIATNRPDRLAELRRRLAAGEPGL